MKIADKCETSFEKFKGFDRKKGCIVRKDVGPIIKKKVWEEIFSGYSNEFKKLFSLDDIIYVIPVERRFRDRFKDYLNNEKEKIIITAPFKRMISWYCGCFTWSQFERYFNNEIESNEFSEITKNEISKIQPGNIVYEKKLEKNRRFKANDYIKKALGIKGIEPDELNKILGFYNKMISETTEEE